MERDAMYTKRMYPRRAEPYSNQLARKMRRTDEEKPGTSSAVGLAALPLASKQVLRLRAWSAIGTAQVHE
jgi:hypothetical protein